MCSVSHHAAGRVSNIHRQNRKTRCNARISARTRQLQVVPRNETKKTLFPRRNRAGQDGTVVLARGCLPTFTHHKLSELLLELHLQSCCYLNCHCITTWSLAFNITWLQPPADSRANCMDRALFALLLLPTALLLRRVRQPRQTAINGTVQNNAGEDRVDGARSSVAP